MGAVTLLVVAVDQLTKWWAVNALADGPIDLVWTLRFRLVFNTGASFSLAPSAGPVIAVVALVVGVFVVRAAREPIGRPRAVVLGVVAGGVLGNAADRIFRADDGIFSGAVIDFVDLQWWPVWNVADAAIVVGGLALLLLESRRAEPDGDA